MYSYSTVICTLTVCSRQSLSVRAAQNKHISIHEIHCICEFASYDVQYQTNVQTSRNLQWVRGNPIENMRRLDPIHNYHIADPEIIILAILFSFVVLNLGKLVKHRPKAELRRGARDDRDWTIQARADDRSGPTEAHSVQRGRAIRRNASRAACRLRLLA